MKRHSILLALTLVACGDSTQEAAPPAISEAEYTAAQVEAELEHLRACCEEIGLNVSDDAALRESLERGVEFRAPDPKSGARYDDQAASRCVAAQKSAPCGLRKDEREALPGCSEIYERGTYQVGDECKSFYDCAQAPGELTTCDVIRVEASGTLRGCRRVVYADEGENCVSNDVNETIWCTGVLLCDAMTTKRCVAPAKRGETCLTGPNWGDTCAKGSVCDRSGTKRCVEPTAIGEACQNESLCEGMACIEGECREPLFDVTGLECAP